jgi:hypothetical protein
MGEILKLIALSIPPENTIGLIPLVTWLCLAVAGLVGVCLYGVRRVMRSEGLAPGRVEQPYEGPALTWTPGAEPAPKLVTHDTLGLAADLEWLNRRAEVPASLTSQSDSSESILALELAAKVFSSNLASNEVCRPERQKFSAEPLAAQKLAALKNPLQAPQPRRVVPAPAGLRLRKAVLRAANPLASWAPTPRPAADAVPAGKSPSAAPNGPAPSAAVSLGGLPCATPAALKSSTTVEQNPAPISSHFAPLAAALASAKPAQSLAPPIEGKVKEYSFSDFVSAAPETATNELTKTSGK